MKAFSLLEKRKKKCVLISIKNCSSIFYTVFRNLIVEIFFTPFYIIVNKIKPYKKQIKLNLIISNQLIRINMFPNNNLHDRFQLNTLYKSTIEMFVGNNNRKVRKRNGPVIPLINS